MKFQQIIQAVYFEPWAITREGWSSVHAIVRRKLEGMGPEQTPSGNPEVDFFGNPMPKFEFVDGVATIPVCGTLVQHASLIEKMCGACSYDDVSRDLETAGHARGLEKIVLKIDSPGGMCQGNQEVASKVAAIRDAGIRIEAITDTQMCSAAYNIAAGANEIYCTPSSVVGSIGAMSAMLDESLAYEMQGVKVDLIASGPLKGTGFPGTSLTPAQREYMQGIVDHYAGMFKTHVQANRPVDDETMQGQVFIGSQARDVGLVDEVISQEVFTRRVDDAKGVYGQNTFGAE